MQGSKRSVLSSYDYIVIGGGTAGCVVATRLIQKEPGATVLVLERGQDETANPGLQFASQNTVLLPEAYETIPATVEFSSETTNYQAVIRNDSFKIIYPWTLGGGPTVSGCFWGRADPSNFIQWASMGVTGWSYSDVLPFYKSIESFKQPYYPDVPVDSSRGTNGPIKTLSLNGREPSIQPIIESLKNVTGLPWIYDYNTPAGQVGISSMQRNTGHDLNNPVRSTTWTGYLKPLIDSGNPRITLLTSATVTQINWATAASGKKKATKVEFLWENEYYSTKVDRELVLSAGTMNTPHLLLISGVGPQQHLQSKGIPVQINLPGVGRNLQDHMVYIHTFIMNPDAFPGITDPTPPIIAFQRSTPSGQVDLEVAWSVLPPFGPGYPPVLVCYIVGLKNAARGFVELRNRDTLYRPHIRYNLATVDSDFDKIIYMFRKVKAWFADLNTQGLALAETEPWSNIPADAPDSAWLDMLRIYCDDWWHPAGTCKMGAASDAMAVVDSRLRLRGTVNVRVADNSVMPTIVSTHPSATAMVIGERCAKFVSEDSMQLSHDLLEFPESDSEDSDDEFEDEVDDDDVESAKKGKSVIGKRRRNRNNKRAVGTQQQEQQQLQASSRNRSRAWKVLVLLFLFAMYLYFLRANHF